MISRAHRSPVSDWWWTVDRPMVSLVTVLLLTGCVLSFAASPPVAERLGLEPLHFVIRLALMVMVLFFGQEIKGSRRWLFLAGMSLQPSEMMKGPFIVITAWLFA